MTERDVTALRERVAARWAALASRIDPHRWDEMRAAYQRAREEGR